MHLYIELFLKFFRILTFNLLLIGYYNFIFLNLGSASNPQNPPLADWIGLDWTLTLSRCRWEIPNPPLPDWTQIHPKSSTQTPFNSAYRKQVGGYCYS